MGGRSEIDHSLPLRRFQRKTKITTYVGCKPTGNLRNDDEGTTDDDASHPGKTGPRVSFLEAKLKVKRTILREDDGILSHYKLYLSMASKD